MSVCAMSWAWDQPVSAEKQLILLALADDAAEAGVVHYTPDSMARKVRMSPVDFETHLSHLNRRGLIEPWPVDPAAPEGYACLRLKLEK